MEALLKKRKVLKAKLTRMEGTVEFLETQPQPLERPEVVVQLEIMDTIGQDVQNLEDEILVTCHENDFDCI